MGARKTCIRLGPVEAFQLDAMSAHTGQPMGALIRRAVRQFCQSGAWAEGDRAAVNRVNKGAVKRRVEASKKGGG